MIADDSGAFVWRAPFLRWSFVKLRGNAKCVRRCVGLNNSFQRYNETKDAAAKNVVSKGNKWKRQTLAVGLLSQLRPTKKVFSSSFVFVLENPCLYAETSTCCK